MENILEVKNLKTQFQTTTGNVYAVNGVSLYLRKGETLGIVGESGSGKSVSMMSLLRLLPKNAKISSDGIVFKGKHIEDINESEIMAIRGDHISMVFQEAMTALNPVLTVGFQLTEGLRLHKGMSLKDARLRAAELLGLVGIPSPDNQLNRYTFEFSGGMLQRVMIAIAVACNPDILIADEPTTALDVTVQAQVISLVQEMKERLSMSVIWITHDLAVIAGIADRVMVMYSGFVMESAPVKELFKNPKHPYTIGLLGSVPSITGKRHEKLFTIPGQPPNITKIPTRCPFSDRCYKHDKERCDIGRPELKEVGPEHFAACWLVD